jgi:hypothetical protein
VQTLDGIQPDGTSQSCVQQPWRACYLLAVSAVVLITRNLSGDLTNQLLRMDVQRDPTQCSSCAWSWNG